jgi:hypothetical protein
MKHEKDLEFQKSFQDCKSSLVYEFCKFNSIDTQVYEDETGIRFFIHYNDDHKECDRIYCSPDNGFTYYITYTKFRDKLINDFTRFKKLKVFL